MNKNVALHVGCDYQRQQHISRHLESLGFEIHKAPTIPAAKELSINNRYRLVLMHFDTIRDKVFDFCSFMHSGDTHPILIALMAKVRTDIGKKLFTHGVNDVVAGKQASASALAVRIKSHFIIAAYHLGPMQISLG